MLTKALALLLFIWSAPFALSAPDAGAPFPLPGTLPREAVYRVVRSHQEAIKSCYEEQVAKHPDLQGSVEVGWTIEKDGSVSGARVVRSTISEKNVESCIVAEVGRWRFITAPERTVVARFPFVFKTMPIGGKIVELVFQNKLLFLTSTRRDFSDAIRPGGTVRP